MFGGSSSHVCNDEDAIKGLEDGGGTSIVPIAAAKPPDSPSSVGIFAGLARHGDLILEGDTRLLPTRVIFHDPGFRGIISIQISETASVSQLSNHLCRLLSQSTETACLLHQGQELDPKLPLTQQGVVLPSFSGRRRGSEIHVVCSMQQRIDPAKLQRLVDDCPAAKRTPLQALHCLAERGVVAPAWWPAEDLAATLDDKDSDMSSEWYNVPSLHLSHAWSELSATSKEFDDHQSFEDIVGAQLDDEWSFCLEGMD